MVQKLKRFNIERKREREGKKEKENTNLWPTKVGFPSLDFLDKISDPLSSYNLVSKMIPLDPPANKKYPIGSIEIDSIATGR